MLFSLISLGVVGHLNVAIVLRMIGENYQKCTLCLCTCLFYLSQIKLDWIGLKNHKNRNILTKDIEKRHVLERNHYENIIHENQRHIHQGKFDDHSPISQNAGSSAYSTPSDILYRLESVFRF